MDLSPPKQVDTTVAEPPAPTEPPPASPSSKIVPRSRSPLARSLSQFRADRLAVAALVVLGLLIAVAILSRFWTPYEPNRQRVGPLSTTPSGDFWLGTDDVGRDILSRLMVGTFTSLRVAFQVVAGALVIAVPLGLISGYFGRLVDEVIMRVMDALTSIPGLVMAVAIAGVLGPGLRNATIAITIMLIPAFARVVRAQALSVSREFYVSASRAIGTRAWRIVVLRVLPGVLPALIVQTAVALGIALSADAALSFLGLGVPPPDASWGNMIQRGYRNVYFAPWAILPPAVAIAVTVLAFNLIGDGLRDALGVGTKARPGRKIQLGLTRARSEEGRRWRRNAASDGPSESVSPSPGAVLSVKNLEVEFEVKKKALAHAVEDVSFDVRPGEVLAIVGESGSGKTATALGLTRLLASPPGVVSGSVYFEGTDLLRTSFQDIRKLRGSGIGMIFQNPMTSLDPTARIRTLLYEAISSHESMTRKGYERRAIELLDLVRIPNAAQRLDDYPHQYSGGMRQRVMIAMALANNPRLLIADEPTTALDVTVQARILNLLGELRREMGLSILIITHDLGVVAQIADRVTVMYGAQIVEIGEVGELFRQPRHPYTAALLQSIPSITGGDERLATIPGTVPAIMDIPRNRCRFADRCSFATDECRSAPPALVEVAAERFARCVHAHSLELRGV